MKKLIIQVLRVVHVGCGSVAEETEPSLMEIHWAQWGKRCRHYHIILSDGNHQDGRAKTKQN